MISRYVFMLLGCLILWVAITDVTVASMGDAQQSYWTKVEIWLAHFNAAAGRPNKLDLAKMDASTADKYLSLLCAGSQLDEARALAGRLADNSLTRDGGRISYSASYVHYLYREAAIDLQRGGFDQAQAIYDKVLNYELSFPDRPKSAKGLGIAYNNLGLVLFLQGTIKERSEVRLAKFLKAQDMLTKAEPLLLNADRGDKLSLARNELAVFQGLGDMKRVVDLRQSIKQL